MHEHKALWTRFHTFYCCYLTCCVQTSSISSTLELSRIAVPCSLAAGQLNSNLPTWAGKSESTEKDGSTWMWGRRKGREGVRPEAVALWSPYPALPPVFLLPPFQTPHSQWLESWRKWSLGVGGHQLRLRGVKCNKPRVPVPQVTGCDKRII